MSLVYITHHNENVHDFDEEIGTDGGSSEFGRVRIKPKKYTSSTAYGQWLRKKLAAEYTKQQIVHIKSNEFLLTDAKLAFNRSMGCAQTPISPPRCFLRKNGGIKWRRENTHVCPPSRDMPPVPSHNCGKRREKSSVDFIARNVERARTACPRRPPPRYIDTPIGSTHNLINSGLIPQFICRKSFGKVPCYIKDIKKVLEDMRVRCDNEQEAIRAKCKNIQQAAAFDIDTAQMKDIRVMEKEERKELLEGLRQHLVELTKNYQSMSLHTDTIAKRNRKGKLESDLRQVEQDIALMENSPIIYISAY